MTPIEIRRLGLITVGTALTCALAGCGGASESENGGATAGPPKSSAREDVPAGANTITICYEDTDWAQRIFTEAGDPDPDASAINSEYATFYHEVGHMAISVYDLPVTGREEDVADQLAAYVLLTPGEDGRTDPESVQAVKDFARAFGASGAERYELDAADFADEHSLDETRMYNLECWIYGSNPEANRDLVADGQLPEDRASGCQEEWAQLDQAWSTLLDPYFK